MSVKVWSKNVWFLVLFAVSYASCAHGLFPPNGMVRMSFSEEQEYRDGKRRVLPLQVLPLHRPVRALLEARLIIVNPDEDDYCREVCCDWGDGSVSCSQETSCIIEEETMAALPMPRRLKYTSSYWYRSPGLYSVKMTLKGSKRRSLVSDLIMVGVPPARW